MNKNVVVGLLLITAVLLVGCVDYKAYDVPNSTSQRDSMLQEAEEPQSNTTPPQTTQDTAVVNVTPKTNTDTTNASTATQPVAENRPNNRSLSEATIKVKENELVKVRVNYSDPDRDPVTLKFNKPLDNKGEWKTSYGDAGEYQTTLTASDGKLTTSTKLKIIVERVNVAPTIEGITDLRVKEGETIRFEPKVTDPNKDPIQITISDPLKTGVFKTDHTSAGKYNVKITASDGDLSTEKSFILEVQDINVKPKISNVKDITVKEGDTITLKPTIEDLDGDKVKVEISDPVGNDGVWETRFTDHGQFTITIIADDGKEKVTQKISVVVQDINMAPEIVSVNLAR